MQSFQYSYHFFECIQNRIVVWLFGNLFYQLDVLNDPFPIHNKNGSWNKSKLWGLKIDRIPDRTDGAVTRKGFQKDRFPPIIFPLR